MKYNNNIHSRSRSRSHICARNPKNEWRGEKHKKKSIHCVSQSALSAITLFYIAPFPFTHLIRISSSFAWNHISSFHLESIFSVLFLSPFQLSRVCVFQSFSPFYIRIYIFSCLRHRIFVPYTISWKKSAIRLPLPLSHFCVRWPLNVVSLVFRASIWRNFLKRTYVIKV